MRRTPLEARERRRARRAERRALEALAARIRSTALDGYEASQGDGGDTSDARRVDVHRNENQDVDAEPPTSSSLRDVQLERDALLLRVEHLERAAARDSTAAVAGVAERAAEETRVAFVDRLTDAASALAEAREETRALRARVADLERTAPARAAALEEATRARIAEAVSEERARGDARLRAAADAVAEAHHAKVTADARAARDATAEALREELRVTRVSLQEARARTEALAKLNKAASLATSTARSSEQEASASLRRALGRDVDELARAATARWGGEWNAKARDDTFRKDDDPGVAIRRIAARLRAETMALGDERPGRELASLTTPSRKPLLAEYY
jgi:hypothetical protein